MQIGGDAATVMTYQQAACSAGAGGQGLAASGAGAEPWLRGLSVHLCWESTGIPQLRHGWPWDLQAFPNFGQFLWGNLSRSPGWVGWAYFFGAVNLGAPAQGAGQAGGHPSPHPHGFRAPGH